MQNLLKRRERGLTLNLCMDRETRKSAGNLVPKSIIISQIQSYRLIVPEFIYFRRKEITHYKELIMKSASTRPYSFNC